jgi:hypothetical protein
LLFHVLVSASLLKNPRIISFCTPSAIRKAHYNILYLWD